MKNNKWIYELYNEEIWTSGEDFNTKEEAIQAGREEALENEDITSFYVGKIVDYIPSVNVYQIIDNLIEDAVDQCGEISENFLDNITKEQYARLQELLDEALNKWLNETSNQPNFYMIKNVEIIKVKELEEN